MKLMSFLFVVALSTIIASAQSSPPKNWKGLLACGVRIYVPPDVVFLEDQSVDTCERTYRGKTTTIHVTVTEWTVGQSDYSNWPDHCVAKISLQTKNAELVTSQIPIVSEPDKGRDFSAMLLVPNFRPRGDDLRIRTWSTSETNRKEAILILKSVKFQ